MINLTDNAVEAVSRFIASSNKPILGLRIRVEGGGCSGFQYGMKLEEQAGNDDEIFEISGLKMLVDSNSLPLIDGVIIDYVESMEASGFKFENPNASNSCGCGKSFSC